MRGKLAAFYILVSLMAFDIFSCYASGGQEQKVVRETVSIDLTQLKESSSSPQRTRKRNPSKKTTTPAKNSKTTKNTTSNKKTTTGSKASGSTVTTPKTSAEAKRRQQEAQKEIRLTEEQIRQNEASVKQNLAELGKLDQDISATNAKIKELNVKVSRLGGEIQSLETGIATNETELEKLRAEYLKAVKKMRVTRKNKSMLAFIFSSKNMSQAMRRMRYLREFSAWRNRQTEEISAKTEDLKRQRDALAKAREEQTSALSQQKSSQAKLAQQHSRQEAIVADLKKNGAALQSHLKRKQTEARELGNMVSNLIAQEQRKAAEEEARRQAAVEQQRRLEAEEDARREAEMLAQNVEKQQEPETGVKKNSTYTKDSKTNKPSKGNTYSKPDKSSKPVETGRKPSEYADARKRASRSKASPAPSVNNNVNAGGGNFQDMRGKLSYPTTGSFTVTSRFGRQYLPDLPDVEYDNPGIDAETEAGASARAVFKGKVSGVYLLPGYNTVVIVNHGNYYTVYGNISNPSVKTGDPVEAGTMLGSLALSDDSRHSSIHFEVWRNREKLNPQDWLR